jgi:hypothetical protein
VATSILPGRLITPSSSTWSGDHIWPLALFQHLESAGVTRFSGGPESTGAPRRQVPARLTTTSGVVPIVEARPKRRARQKFSLGPGGCRLQNLTLARLPAGWASIERRYGSFRSHRRQQQFITGAIQWTSANIQTRSTWPHRPSPPPIHPRHKPNPTNPLPIRTNHNNSCFTRLALVVRRASLVSTTVVSTAVAPGAENHPAGVWRRSASAVAGGTIETW